MPLWGGMRFGCMHVFAYMCVCVNALQCCTPRHLLSLNWKLKRRIRESPVSLCAVKLLVAVREHTEISLANMAT